MSDNTQQIEFWNGLAGERWAAAQETIDRTMAMIHAALLPFAAPRPGERVLDLGCGSGTTSLALAKAVGEQGSVTGIDISVPMLTVARRRAEGAKTPMSFIDADASVYVFRPEFDLVFSRFGWMFFADPDAAFANIRKALKPSGRLACVTWRTLQENAWAAAPLGAAFDLLPPQEPVDPLAPGPFAFADPARIASVLTKAGFREAKAERLDTVMMLGGSTADAAQFALSIGPLSRAAAEVDDATRAKIATRVREALAKYQTPAGIAPPAACWLVSARP